MESKESLFVQSSKYKKIVALVDASGSVRSIYQPPSAKYDPDQTVFAKQCEVLMRLDADSYHLIFWNSPRSEDAIGHNGLSMWSKGLVRMPHVVKKDKLVSTFKAIAAQEDQFWLTYPHLAFDELLNHPEDWLSDGTTIVLVTDGQMSGGHVQLADAIKALFTKYPFLRLEIFTVEPQEVGLGQVENLRNAAGADVFKCIQERKLTPFVSNFTSFNYTSPEGFVHLKQSTAPKGFVPYADKLFSQLRTRDFIIHFLRGEIKKHAESDDELVKILQNLTATLAALTKDKPLSLREDMLSVFCRLFEGTCLDTNLVRFLLSGAIQQHQAGQAQLLATFRQQMKNLYKQAQQLLAKNAKHALGIQGEMMTWLTRDDKIFTGHSRHVQKDLKLARKQTFANAAINVNVKNDDSEDDDGDTLVAALPLGLNDGKGPMSEQCHRQYVRAIVGTLYNVDPMGDIAMYTALAVVLRVVLSSSAVLRDIKARFQQIGLWMLQKKCAGVDKTELQRLLEGYPPTMNNSGDIIDTIRRAQHLVFAQAVPLEPMTFWFGICSALEIKGLCEAQWTHCRSDIIKDFKNVKECPKGNDFLALLPEVKTVQHVALPIESVLDYQCLITTDDVSSEGGFRIAAHEGGCEPIYVLSKEGLEQMFANNKKEVACPICLEQMLTRDDFLPVGPQKTKRNLREPAGLAKAKCSSNDGKAEKKINKILVLMEGCVGAGKSTCAYALKEHVEKEYKALCQVEGVDKYINQGQSLQGAIRKVTESCGDFIERIAQEEPDKAILVIDVCGPHPTQANAKIFEHTFEGWQRFKWRPNFLGQDKIDKYLAWCLMHVLDRKMPRAEDHHSLNPETSGLDVCLEVHSKKSRPFTKQKQKKKKGSNIEESVSVDRSSLEAAKASVAEAAQKYQELLDASPNLSIQRQVETMVAKLKLDGDKPKHKTRRPLYWAVALDDADMVRVLNQDQVQQSLQKYPNLVVRKQFHSTLLYLGSSSKERKEEPDVRAQEAKETKEDNEKILGSLEQAEGKSCCLFIDKLGISPLAAVLTVKRLVFTSAADNDKELVPSSASLQHVTVALASKEKAVDSIKALDVETVPLDPVVVVSGKVAKMYH